MYQSRDSSPFALKEAPNITLDTTTLIPRVKVPLSTRWLHHRLRLRPALKVTAAPRAALPYYYYCYYYPCHFTRCKRVLAGHGGSVTQLNNTKRKKAISRCCMSLLSV